MKHELTIPLEYPLLPTSVRQRTQCKQLDIGAKSLSPKPFIGAYKKRSHGFADRAGTRVPSGECPHEEDDPARDDGSSSGDRIGRGAIALLDDSFDLLIGSRQ